MGYGFLKLLEFIKECIFEVIYDGKSHCIICERYLEESGLCDECKRYIVLSHNVYTMRCLDKLVNCYSAAYYTGTMMELIRRLKYKSDFKSGEIIAYYMKDRIRNFIYDIDFITYVPMTKKSLKLRGYNQSKFLCNLLSKEFNIPVINCLTKTKETKDQIGLSQKQRWENMRDCFKIKKSQMLKNKKVLLVDDVFTTGSTAYFCSYELIKCGVEKINILTAAKSKV